MIAVLRRSAALLDRAAAADARRPSVRTIARALRDPHDRRATVARAWRWLPTRYIAERDGDRWQRSLTTLRLGTGDCEDWSIVLAAVLTAAGIDARIATMPLHVAVAIPGAPVSRAAAPLMHRHAGRAWLFLESTLSPRLRAVVPPGWGTDHIAAWADTPYLQIARSHQEIP